MNRKVEKGLATRQAILQSANRLFATAGFGATSIEAVLEACGISRGALYHHFPNKEALFEAVFDRLEAQIAQKLLARARAGKDPIEALRAGCDAWLDLARDPEIRQIVFIDAPSVLGWEKWRAIDARHGFGLLRSALAAAGAKGIIPPPLIETFSHMLLASLIEVAMLIARAPDPAAATKIGKRAVNDLLAGMLRERAAK